jgi:hypothetical protein
MSWDMFFGIFASNYGGGENGVGWGKACSNSEGRQEAQFGNKSINEGSGNEPPLKMNCEG